MLTDAETIALRNLANKKAGALTTFVNIADARRLTDLGLAQRSRQGWDITDEGSAYLAAVGPDEGYAPLKLAPDPQPLRGIRVDHGDAAGEDQEQPEPRDDP